MLLHFCHFAQRNHTFTVLCMSVHRHTSHVQIWLEHYVAKTVIYLNYLTLESISGPCLNVIKIRWDETSECANSLLFLKAPWGCLGELMWPKLNAPRLSSSQGGRKWRGSVEEVIRTGCYGYQPDGSVGGGLLAAASSSSVIKVSLTNRPTYQKPPSPSLAGQQDTRLAGQQGHEIRHATRQDFELNMTCSSLTWTMRPKYQPTVHMIGPCPVRP